MEDNEEYTPSEIFVVVWDCTGLESVIPVSAIQRQETFDILCNKRPEKDVHSIINHAMLRARVNGHRFYEIYALTTVDGITAADITQMFNDDPQYAADLIRSKGNKIYSDRANPDRIKIK